MGNPMLLGVSPVHNCGVETALQDFVKISVSLKRNFATFSAQNWDDLQNHQTRYFGNIDYLKNSN